VTLCEAGPRPLAKVLISGGGRCNVTHACFEPRELVKSYPRGARELLGAFHRWQPRDTIAWFEDRGVRLKTEADGRVFPVSDQAAEVTGCLEQAASRAGVSVLIRSPVTAVAPGTGSARFTVRTGDTEIAADSVLLATGGARAGGITDTARALGHTVEPPVPSLFTFNTDDTRIAGLAGLSMPEAAVSIVGSREKARGPVLVTHQGFSGPAILRLSAWGARELAALEYRFELDVNWIPTLDAAGAADSLRQARAQHPRKQVGNANPFGVPSRLWERLAQAAGIDPATPWTSVSNAALGALAAGLVRSRFGIKGKSPNKEEFVTCGGARLSEVDFRTMESRVQPGLHFAGEVLDIDGLTGGFNLQAAWTTGWLAGRAMAGQGASTI
jgi:predicted Rossmann fold flavoprotein